MARIKYFYNTETCKYERAVTSLSDRIINISAFCLLSIFFSCIIVFIYFSFFDSPKELMLKEENSALKNYYQSVNNQLTEATETLKELQSRDKEIYRIIFEANPINKLSYKSNSKGVETIKHFFSKNDNNEGLVKTTLSKISEIKEQLLNQEYSFEELLKLAQRKEEMLASIPAIQPISNKTLKALASGYGMRIHPIYKVKKFHAGIDFSAVRGTPIYATGNGFIQTAGIHEGYGNYVEIDHGFGYMTRYGHLDKIKVKKGKKIKRGEIIGFVGSTGTATSPHLHYEVHKNGNTVDPVHFFFNDLTPKEYEQLIKISSVENQSLGGI